MRKSNYRVVAVSDLHGHLPRIPPCDLLLIAGDICPDDRERHSPSNIHKQVSWLNSSFLRWLHSVQAEWIVATPGNHDIALQRMRVSVSSDVFDRCTMLVDQEAIVDGWKVWGTPWVGRLPGEAWNLHDGDLDVRFSRIPSDVDILLTHTPPYGVGDAAWEFLPDGTLAGTDNVGSTSLLERIERIQPVLAVCGHIHEARGAYTIGETQLVNASICNRYYQPTNPPWATYLDHLPLGKVRLAA